jgi:hypothetical protein
MTTVRAIGYHENAPKTKSRGRKKRNVVEAAVSHPRCG